MPEITDEEYEIAIRRFYLSHKKKRMDEKLLCILLALALLLLISFIGAFISMMMK